MMYTNYFSMPARVKRFKYEMIGIIYPQTIYRIEELKNTDVDELFILFSLVRIKKLKNTDLKNNIANYNIYPILARPY